MTDERVEKNRYEFQEIEAKWQKRWQETGLFRVENASDKPKFYALSFFPYPSGAGISVGHCRNYVPVDVSCRYKTMKGYNVLNPMGWDAFGQPAENEAIKRKRNPKEMVPEYAANYKRQLNLVGNSYDWSREIDSSRPDYYQWTQWFFLLLHKRGLAYQANTPINWCPSCKTGLANEEVVAGKCWRCGTTVEKRPMPQWYFKITEYADRLISGLDAIEWPEGIKIMQREWIGRSEGAEVEFKIPNSSNSIKVFTTRPDTLWGATFMVLAPEHSLVETLTTPEQKEAIEAYRAEAKGKTEIERQNAERTKSGVFTGSYATNPATGEPIPIWIADYVLMGYGTGAIMAVPAHDQRDFEFARKFDIPIVIVYRQNSEETAATMIAATPTGGTCVAGPFVGAPNDKATVGRVIAWIEERGVGKGVVNFRLRDWLVSRQRYWGAPIPIIHCESCGAVPVPEKDLPVTLPDVERYEPSGTGQSPLAGIPEFVNTTCPSCGKPAKRETDTMAGFACSSWYFLRFADPHNSEAAFSPEAAKYWLPVDDYVGGAEHAVMHLLYARFWTKVMFDAGLVTFDEPFQRLRNQGMLLAYTPVEKETGQPLKPQELVGYDQSSWADRKKKEGVFEAERLIGTAGAGQKTVPVEVDFAWIKMSKSSGNVVTPDEMAQQYGADSLRTYCLFVAPFEETVLWESSGMEGASRWVNRVYRLWNELVVHFNPAWKDSAPKLEDLGEEERRLKRKLHQTIRKVSEDIENFRFNTCVAALMEFTNSLSAFRNGLEGRVATSTEAILISEVIETLPLMLSPITPHLADECWERLGKSGSTYKEAFPEFDVEAIIEDSITIVLQVNGKLKDRLVAPVGILDEEIQSLALSNEKVMAELIGKQVRKVIVVPGKLVNIVAG